MAASVAGPPSVAEALHSWYVYQLFFFYLFNLRQIIQFLYVHLRLLWKNTIKGFLIKLNSAKIPIEMRYSLDRTIRSSKDIKSV